MPEIVYCPFTFTLTKLTMHGMGRGLACKLKVLTMSEHLFASMENIKLIEMLKLQVRYLILGNV